MFSHCELRQAVHSLQLPAGHHGGLLGRRLTVQVVVGQGLHRTHPLPNESNHLLLVDGQVQVLTLQGWGTTNKCQMQGLKQKEIPRLKFYTIIFML